MAKQQHHYYFLLGLILMMSGGAQGQLLSVANIIGNVCCGPNGSCSVPGALPLAGVPFNVTCTSLELEVVVGQGTTSASGGINITVPLLTPILASVGSILPCNVTIQLPVSSVVCPVLSTSTGILTGVIQLVGTTLSTIFGLIASTEVTVFFTVLLV